MIRGSFFLDDEHIHFYSTLVSRSPRTDTGFPASPVPALPVTEFARKAELKEMFTEFVRQAELEKMKALTRQTDLEEKSREHHQRAQSEFVRQSSIIHLISKGANFCHQMAALPGA